MLNNKNTFKRTLTEHRKKVSALKSELPLASDINIIETFINLLDDAKIPLWIFRPISGDVLYPTLLYIPGTAFVAQEVDITQAICSQIASLANCQVIVVNHRLAPENSFPRGLSDAWQITQMMTTAPPKKLQIDLNQIILAGYSSGGNFAAQIALTANLPIRCQILASPLVDLSRSLSLYREFEQKDNAISDEFVRWFLHLYLPKNINSKHPYVSPFFQNKYKKPLAPTYLLYGEHDRFRSDAEAYHEKLQAAGAASYRKIFANSDHSFLWYKQEAIEAIAKIVRFSVHVSLQQDLIHQFSLMQPASIKPDIDKTEHQIADYKENTMAKRTDSLFISRL